MNSGRQGRSTERQAIFTRQATILRKNLLEWDRMLRTPKGEDWPTMLGRMNAAMNQTSSMDRNIEDVMEHFVYLPVKSPANPGDIPFFLSTRLEAHTDNEQPAGEAEGESESILPKSSPQQKSEDPVRQLARYENRAAELAADFEENMVRY